MANKNAGLGKGLGALLGEEAVRVAQDGALTLRIAQIEPNAAQPRKDFNEDALRDLAESIRLHGVLQPLVVRRLSNGYYQIVAGERRWRAARMAGLDEVPAVIFEADDRKSAEIALVENLQRENLNPIEEAQGIYALVEEYGLTQEETALRLGRSRSAVANALRLLGLEPSVKTLVLEEKLSAGHARALLTLPHPQQIQAARQIVSQNLSVRQTEALVKKLAAPAQKERPQSPNYLEEHERRLSGGLGRRVKIVAGRKKGRVEIEFYDVEDLDRLIAVLDSLSVQ